MIKQKMKLPTAFFLALCLPVFNSFAQKHFTLSVRLPEGVNKEAVEVYLDNGKRLIPLKSQPTQKDELLLTGEYYSLYAAIDIQCQTGIGANTQTVGKTFFIEDKPAFIQFYPSDSIRIFDSYKLENVLDFKDEEKQMKALDTAERRIGREMEIKYGDSLFTGKDTAASRYYFQVLRNAQGLKKLKYIVENPNSYYSFYNFRTEVVRRSILPADSMLTIFNRVFPDKFKYSEEGNFLNENLHGQLSQQKQINFVDFTTKDIKGKVITLSRFLNQKMVLLHFWATWCSPCMAELPLVKELSDKYGKNDLQIISVALKSNTNDFKKTIKIQHMNWIHVYNKPDLENKFGNFPVPRLILLDKSGTIMYDNAGKNKTDTIKLSQLQEALKKSFTN